MARQDELYLARECAAFDARHKAYNYYEPDSDDCFDPTAWGLKARDYRAHWKETVSYLHDMFNIFISHNLMGIDLINEKYSEISAIDNNRERFKEIQRYCNHFEKWFVENAPYFGMYC